MQRKEACTVLPSAFVCIFMSREGIYGSLHLCVCVCVYALTCLWHRLCVCMRCVYVLCVSCEQVSKIQTVFKWVANQPIKRKYQKPLNHLQC